ncbi:hypothetical protein PG996_007683 [Apiospora saccharicola]|uniref:Uncharacterized protein n=1 Tax=Apiospora saccharicola TaxID=335842 RepID=A0ABR1VE35_9PEZI
MPIALFTPEIIAAATYASIGGSLAAWCGTHKDDNQCNKHGMLDASSSSDVGPCGVPQYNWDLCHAQLPNITVMTSIPADSEGQFDNVPPACMDLAAVLSGDCTDTTIRPTVCGSACLHYSGLTDDDYANISIALTS